MPKSVPALVTPDLLVWARETAGLSPEVAADKLRIRRERLAGWERGAERPTFAQLKGVGQLYRQPLAIFYLPERPKTLPSRRPHDFRRLPGDAPGASPKLVFEIRKSSARREQALDLAADLGVKPRDFPLTARVDEDPEMVAERIRQFLGVTTDLQSAWSGQYEHFHGWRGAVEDRGVLVFQASGIEMAEMRAFSIAAFPMPIVVVNSKDTTNGRVFSMLHEICHLLLHQDGLCIPGQEGDNSDPDQTIEAFCNHVAGAALVPRKPLAEDPAIRARLGIVEWTETELQGVATRFGASREVVLRRLLILGRTTQDHYNRMRRLFQVQQEQAKPRESKGGPAPDVMALTRSGTLFTKLAIESYHQQKITLSDLSDLLEVKVRYLRDIEDAASKKPVSLY